MPSAGGPTAKERAAQSQRDRLRNQALAALSLQRMSRQAPPPPGPARGPPSRARGKRNSGKPSPVDRHLISLRKGLPCPVPTRLEILHFRVRYSLPAGQRHLLLFHPSNSPSLGLGTSFFDAPRDLTTYIREPGLNSLSNWVPEENLQNRLLEAVGRPDSLISSMGRVTGGVMSVKVTGAPSSTGFLVSSNPLAYELQDHLAMYDKHATSVRLRRHEIGEGVRDFVFHAPLLSPALLETFVPANDAYHWSEHDPFGAILLSFHELNYNPTLGMPFIVEVDMQVGVQCRLDLDDRHLATNHTHEHVDVKKNLHNEKDMGVVGTSKGELSKKVQDSASIRDHGGIR